MVGEAWKYKPKTVDSRAAIGLRKLDDNTIRLPRPRKVAGKHVTHWRAKNNPYRVSECPNCKLPAVFVDYRYKGTGKPQYNNCTHCNERIRTFIRGNFRGRIINELAE
jgi:hypothetical protein